MYQHTEANICCCLLFKHYLFSASISAFRLLL